MIPVEQMNSANAPEDSPQVPAKLRDAQSRVHNVDDNVISGESSKLMSEMNVDQLANVVTFSSVELLGLDVESLQDRARDVGFGELAPAVDCDERKRLSASRTRSYRSSERTFRADEGQVGFESDGRVGTRQLGCLLKQRQQKNTKKTRRNVVDL